MTKGIIDEWAEDCGLDDWADVVDDCGIGEGSLKNLKQRIAKALDQADKLDIPRRDALYLLKISLLGEEKE